MKQTKHTPRPKILTDDQIQTLGSMAEYWTEVSKRSDTSPLTFELQQVIRMLGVKILWIVRDYVNAEPKL